MHRIHGCAQLHVQVTFPCPGWSFSVWNQSIHLSWCSGGSLCHDFAEVAGESLLCVSFQVPR